MNMIFIFIIGLVMMAIYGANGQKTETGELKCHVLVKDSDYVYGLNIYPSDKNKELFHWEGLVQNLNTGEIITLFRASTMREQKNVYERLLRPDGDAIKITTSIDRERPRIRYHIQRMKGKQLIFSYKGEKEIILQENR